MNTSFLRPMRKGGFVILSAITCVVATFDLFSYFVLSTYNHATSELTYSLYMPPLSFLATPLLALAGCILLVFATLSVQKSPKTSPLVALSFWMMALSLVAWPIVHHEFLDSLTITACVLLCAVLITAGILSINQLHSAIMSVVVLACGAAFSVYRFINTLPSIQQMWEYNMIFSVISSVITCLLPALFCVSIALLELCKGRLASSDEE